MLPSASARADLKIVDRWCRHGGTNDPRSFNREPKVGTSCCYPHNRGRGLLRGPCGLVTRPTGREHASHGAACDRWGFDRGTPAGGRGHGSGGLGGGEGRKHASVRDEAGRRGAGRVGGGEPVDPLRDGREQDPLPGPAGADRDPGGQVGLAGSGPGPGTRSSPTPSTRRRRQHGLSIGGDPVGRDTAQRPPDAAVHRRRPPSGWQGGGKMDGVPWRGRGRDGPGGPKLGSWLCCGLGLRR